MNDIQYVVHRTFHNYNNYMIGFVTWPPFCTIKYVQVTKPIIIIIIIIITSNDDPKPSTVISEQPPTGLIPRNIKITAGTIL